MIAQGVAANMQGLDQSVVRDDGILDCCRLHDITVPAWSPFQGGFFDGPFLGFDRHPEAQCRHRPVGRAVCRAHRGHCRGLDHPSPARMQVALGTTTPERESAVALGSDVPLTRGEWYELFRAAGYTTP